MATMLPVYFLMPRSSAERPVPPPIGDHPRAPGEQAVRVELLNKALGGAAGEEGAEHRPAQEVEADPDDGDPHGQEEEAAHGAGEELEGEVGDEVGETVVGVVDVAQDVADRQGDHDDADHQQQQPALHVKAGGKQPGQGLSGSKPLLHLLRAGLSHRRDAGG